VASKPQKEALKPIQGGFKATKRGIEAYPRWLQSLSKVASKPILRGNTTTKRGSIYEKSLS
jgi:hypothetical protein